MDVHQVLIERGKLHHVQTVITITVRVITDYIFIPKLLVNNLVELLMKYSSNSVLFLFSLFKNMLSELALLSSF